MTKSKATIIEIIEFYLTHDKFITRELEYRKQAKSQAPISISKLYKPIPYVHALAIMTCIHSALDTMPPKHLEFIQMRYHQGCTLDVISGFLCGGRSSMHALGEQILWDILYAILVNDNAREAILKADNRSYILS